MSKQQNFNAFQTLLNEKIRIFVDAFCDGSRRLFVDSNGELVHPGEFGTFRESITRDFLKGFVPQRMAIDTGFIVNSYGKISSQCDIVIYDRSVTPLLQNADHQRFFPIESVCAVGEVKSLLSLADLKIALRKLSSIKLMRDSLSTPSYVYCTKEDGLASTYEPHRDERDQVVTFLLCEGFKFDLNAKAEEILGCYVEEDPKYPTNLRHNFVLSIKDSLLTYLYPNKNDGTLYPFPSKKTQIFDYGDTSELQASHITSCPLTNRIVFPSPGSFEHVRHFSNMLHQTLTSTVVVK